MRFAVNDGPGIRTTVFLKGCRLSCVWCHNPESQSSTPEPMFDGEKCIACGECIQVCRREALQWLDGQPHRDAEKCELCGECCDACPSDARRLIGYRVSSKELLQKILRDRIVYEESGGGVTFSGGEPLVQPEFLCAMLEACRTEGIHTAVDTCGYSPADTFSRVGQLAEMFLFDVKLIDPERHRQTTGVDNNVIIENLRWAAENAKALIVRIPVVPEINADEENVGESLALLQSIGVEKVDLLPYHRTGTEKYRRLGLGAPAEFVSPAETEMKRLYEKFAARGFTVRIGG